jgi:hypothetical protein
MRLKSQYRQPIAKNTVQPDNKSDTGNDGIDIAEEI